MTRRASVSIAELVADGVPIRPPEALAVIETLSESFQGPDVGIPDAAEIVIFADGQLFAGVIDGGGAPPVKSLANLLRAMLDRAPLGHRVSPDLCRVVALGLGCLSGKKLMTIEGFAEALRPFAGPDPRSEIRQLFARWQSASELPALHPSAGGPPEVILVTTSGFVPSVRLKPDRRRRRRVVFDTGAEVINRTDVSPQATELLAGAPLPHVGLAVTSPGVWKRRASPQRALALVALLIALLIPAGRHLVDTIPSNTHASRGVLTDDSAERQRENARSAATTTQGAVAGLSSAVASPRERSTPRRLPPQSAGLRAAVSVRMTTTGARRPGIRPALAISDERESFESNDTAVFMPVQAVEAADAHLTTSNTAGGDLQVMRIVDDGARNYHVRPSPDGTRVAFDSDRDGTRGIYVANRDGRGVRRVSGEGFAALPSWSPDGTRLAFVRAERENENVWNLWMRDLESGTVRQVSFHREGKTSSASWFPDGTRISYSQGSRLWILDLESGRGREFATPSGSRLHSPAVSPDGARIIFQADRDGAWLLDLQKGGMRRVLEDRSAQALSWSPDGRRVAYYSRRDATWIISPPK
jgi:hypothetical protein